VDLPKDYGVAQAPTPAPEKWWAVFQDPVLDKMIEEALAANYDLRMAAERIEQSRAQFVIARAGLSPDAGVRYDTSRSRSSEKTSFPPPADAIEASSHRLVLTAQWELDFWGKFRRATEAARAQLLATEWGRRAVLATLVSQVSSAYFGLRALDLELDISKRTLESRRESLQLTQVRERGGVTSLLDVRQAEQLVYSATGEIATLEREIAQQENFLSFLVGGNPGPIARGKPLTEQPHQPDVPAGLPSALIERRPDIQRAEQDIVAANAQIGVARAAYFPQIALTGSSGFESTALLSLFTATNAIWTAAASATAPIFTAGRTRSQVALAEARRQEATIAYQQTVRQAFREVSDALIGYRKLREFREQQALLFSAAQDARRLAQVRYEGGVTSYLEVLDADTRLFDAELGLAQAELGERSGFVEIYRALGGGWHE
jgi:multidrug efflux system outer membrane protein